MRENIQIQSLSFFSLAKLVFVGSLFTVGAFALFCGILGLFGFPTVYGSNGEPILGIAALIHGAIIAVLFPLSLTGMVCVLVPLGWWVYGKLFARTLSAIQNHET